MKIKSTEKGLGNTVGGFQAGARYLGEFAKGGQWGWTPCSPCGLFRDLLTERPDTPSVHGPRNHCPDPITTILPCPGNLSFHPGEDPSACSHWGGWPLLCMPSLPGMFVFLRGQQCLGPREWISGQETNGPRPSGPQCSWVPHKSGLMRTNALGGG